MKRIALLGAALVVVAAVLILVFRSDSTTPAATVAAPPPRAATPVAKATPTRPVVGARRPAARRPTPVETSGEPVASREYVNRQGRLIRDHRGGDRPEFNPDQVKSPRKQKIEPRITQGVRSSVYDAVRKCAQNLDTSAFGDKPRAQVEVLMNIEDGQARAAKAQVKLGDVAEEPGQALATCVHEQSKQLAFAAEGHAKISQYRVTLVFPLQ